MKEIFLKDCKSDSHNVEKIIFSSQGRQGIFYNVKNGTKISKGDIILKCICEANQEPNSQNIDFFVKADSDGYFLYPKENPNNHISRAFIGLQEKGEYNCPFIPDADKLSLGYIFDDYEEMCKKEYAFPCYVEQNPITNSKKIKWVGSAFNVGNGILYKIGKPSSIYGSYGHDSSIYDSYIYEYCSLLFDLIDNHPSLSFIYKIKDSIDALKIKLKKGDRICFASEDGKYLELEVLRQPHDCYDKECKVVDFFLLEKDIDVLIKNKFSYLAIIYKDGSPVTYIKNLFYKRDVGWNDLNLINKKTVFEPSENIFKRYVTSYKKALVGTGVLSKKSVKKQKSKIKIVPCFVYIMHDVKNGFYKIGISQTPKYRERTLQSEKPTIELICSKEYPSRKIAEAIEAALHKVYEESRIRGEWFELSDSDVELLIETLK